MKKHILLLTSIAILMIVSCGHKDKEKIPADVIPREQMIDIMTEAWYMESVIHNTIKIYERLEPVSVTMYKNFFEEHGITKEQFTHSIEYYMRDDESSQEFIQACAQRFDERKEEFTGVADSISQPL